MPIEADDWRLQGQERYLKGASLRWAVYRPFRESSDHDHCEFCGAKFLVAGGDLTEGYTTADEYRWICRECVEDFSEMFTWVLTPQPSVT